MAKHEDVPSQKPIRTGTFTLWRPQNHHPKPLIPATSSSRPASAPEVSPTYTQPMPDNIRRPKVDSGQTFLDKFVRPHFSGTPADYSTTGAVSSSLPAPFVKSDTTPPSRPTPHLEERKWGNPAVAATPSYHYASTLHTSMPLTPFRQWMNAECPSMTKSTIEYREEVLNKSDSWAKFHARCQEPLDDDDVDAVLMYTMHSLYLTLNIYLRVGTDEQRAVRQPWAHQLQIAIRKLPQFTGTVFRILNNNRITTDFTRGTEVTWPAFTSCSTTLSSENVTQFGGKDGVASSTLVIHVNSSAELGPLNPYGENEVLLLPGWTGHVVDTVRRDHNRENRALEVAGHSTFLELRQEGFTSDDLSSADGQDYTSAINTAHLHHFRMPSYARNSPVATKAYERAIALDPNNAAACNNYANLLTDVLKQHEKAAEYYERAIALDPNYAAVCNNYALLLKDVLKQHEKAAEYYERAIALDPMNKKAMSSSAKF